MFSRFPSNLAGHQGRTEIGGGGLSRYVFM